MAEDQSFVHSTQADDWPALPYAAWKDTLDTLHMWTQIVGKVRLTQTTWVNHSWNVTLYVTPRGLTTGLVPYGRRAFAIEFDFVAHELVITTSDGLRRTMALVPQSVAAFYDELFAHLNALHLPVTIHATPNEVLTPIPFAEDQTHADYDAVAVQRFFRALLQTERVLQQFRARFRGKSSPVHFYWGSFDLAVTRFSGRPAPEHPGGFPNLPDWVTRDAYSDEVSSIGFWPGNEQVPEAMYFSYAYPEPAGFRTAEVLPAAAYFHETVQEFVLPYDVVRQAANPEAMLLDFAQSTYLAAANAAAWNRSALEHREYVPNGGS